MRDKIAIVSASCLFPGAHSLAEYWDNLINGVDCREDATEADFGMPLDACMSEQPEPNLIYSRRGGFIRDFDFDPEGYQLSSDHLVSLDAVFQWPLHCARQALNALRSDASGALKRCGVILGNYAFPTVSSNRLAIPPWHREVADALESRFGMPAGTLRNQVRGEPEALASENQFVCGLPATVIAAALGLQGPQYSLDAACASAIYAIDLGCRLLRKGRADMMLVGGVCAPDPWLIHQSFSDLRAYPLNGCSQPFSRHSQGICTGQGAAIVILKRLQDAVRNGDRIMAVIDGIGLSNDGSGKHLLTPNPAGQLLAYERAYQSAAVAPETIDYIECHATGTPLGDATELDSLEQFFGSCGHVPRLGSVKGNVGHLLTVAGMSSLLKVILAVEHGEIPATLGQDDVRESPARLIGADNIVRQNEPWPRTGRPRRAAVSSWGFGGTNAHLILSEYAEDQSAERVSDARIPTHGVMDVIGMGACFDGDQSLSDVERRLFGESQGASGRTAPHAEADIHSPSDAARALMNIDAMAFRIPPAELTHFNPQQLLMLQVADEALRDAGHERDLVRSGANKVGIIIVMELDPITHLRRARAEIHQALPVWLKRAGIRLQEDDLAALLDICEKSLHRDIQANEVLSYIGNIMASRIASLWNFNGPVLTLSADGNGLAHAIDAAQLFLDSGDADSMLIGAVEINDSTNGAGAVVLTNADSRSGRCSYARIAGHDFIAENAGERRDDALSAESFRESGLRALKHARTRAESVDLIVLADPRGARDDLHLSSLSAIYSRNAILSASLDHYGNAGVALPMLSLMETALCLSRRHYPAGRHELTHSELPFQTTLHSLPWLRQSTDAPRAAIISSFGIRGSYSHMVLQASDCTDARQTLHETAPFFIVICADDRQQMTARLNDLHAQLSVSGNAGLLQNQHLEQYREDAGFALVLIARSVDEMLAECTRALDKLPQTFESGKAYQTPAGSYLTLSPSGADARIALVYPGGFTSYPMQGRDLFLSFPELLDNFERIVEAPRVALCENTLYPRNGVASTPSALMKVEEALLESIPAMLTLGTSFAILYTKLLRETLGIRVQGAFGYSLGESSMMFANGAWPPSGRSISALEGTPLFRDRLTGRRTLVRETWALPDELPDNEVWSARTILAPVNRVREMLGSFDRLYLTHVNSPTEVVVAGDPAQLTRFCLHIDAPGHRMPTAHVLHAAIMRSESRALAALNDFPTTKPPDIELISGLDQEPIRNFERKTVAENIARTLTDTVDFSKLTESAYARGYRIFIEAGTGGACARWINSTLGERPHLGTYMDRRGPGATHSLLMLAAQLISHRIPLNIRRLRRPVRPVPGRHLTPVSIRGKSVNARVRDGIDKLPLPPAPPRLPAEGLHPKENRIGEPAVKDMNASEQPPRADTDRKDFMQSVLLPQALLTTMMETAHQAHMRFLHSQYSLARSMLRLNGDDVTPSRMLPAPASRPAPSSSPVSVAQERPDGTPPHSPVIMDEDAILAFATGKVGVAFGPEYAAIDQYGTRTRLPSPPYLFVSRVTRLDARRGCFEPCSLTTEYDIPEDAWYLVDGLMPPGVAVEAGQSDLLLIAYLGIDFENRGKRVYRLLDGTLSFRDDLPRAGQTLRFDISIDRFARMGETLLFFFSYKGYVNGKLALQLEEGCAGFFTAEELENGMGVILNSELRARSQLVKPMLKHDRVSLERTDILALSSGNVAQVFGTHYQHDRVSRSLRLPPPDLLMIDRVTNPGLMSTDGSYTMTAYKELVPDAWYFTAHFPDDPVIPGSLMAEGATQLLKIHLLQLGMHHTMADAEFQPIHGLSMKIRVRGQVTPAIRLLRYEACILETGFVPRPFVRANVVVFDGDRPLISVENLGLCIREKPGENAFPRYGDPGYHSGRLSALNEPVLLNEFHLAHAAKGSLETAMGREFAIYNARRGPHIPNGDFQFVDRAIHLTGTRPYPKPGDTMVTEYDMPADSWYFRQNAFPEAPNCVILETALQASILLGYFLGATLQFPDQEYSIRNLDGHARYVRRVDLRGKTIRHRETLVTHAATQNAILQGYDFELLCEGEIFYRGSSLFGYFSPESLRSQIGLDNGKTRAFWHEEANASLASMQSVSLRDESVPPFRSRKECPHFHLAHQQLNLLHEAFIAPSAGRFAKGYVFGRRRIEPDDWYFSRHFHRDPVMPGSLGLESMYQAVQLYALTCDLGARFRSPRFSICLNADTHWKYRGQIVKSDGEMAIELHIKDIRHNKDTLDIIADGELYKGNLRIYEVRSLAVSILEALE